MKTNQIMIRDKAFVQRTKDGYFNATVLVDYWNNSNDDNKKQLNRYKFNKTTKEFVIQLQKEGIEVPLRSGRGTGESSGTWMHPKLFIDLAMWVSVEFKSIVIDYVLDGLINSRHDAGDYYNEMCRDILTVYVDVFKRKPPSNIFIEEARRIRALVTSKPRNEMSEQELNQITYLQKFNANLIRKRIGKTARIKRLMEASEIKI